MADTTSSTVNAEFNLSSLRVPRSLWIGAVAVTLFLEMAVACDPVDDEPAGSPPVAKQQQENVDQTVFRWFFGDDADTARLFFLGDDFHAAPAERLDGFLRLKISVVDRFCGLTDTQKQKLLLAGRGDSKRIIDRFEKSGIQYRLIKDDLEKVTALEREVEPFTRGTRPWFRDGGSLFLKTLEQTLTADQLAKYEPLRSVYREGGVVDTSRFESGEVLWIDLSETGLRDDDLASLSKLPGLQFLFIDNTQVTDAAMLHLKLLTQLRELGLSSTRVTDKGLTNLGELTKLKWLALAGTQVTDAGLVHLSELSSLKEIWLRETKVSNAGVAKLQEALPELRVKR